MGVSRAVLVSLSLALTCATAVPAAPTSLPEPWVVQVSYPDADTRDRLAAELDLWAVEPERGVLIAAVTAAEYQQLLGQGLTVELDLARTKQLHRQRPPAEGGGIPGFPCYRTVEETLATAQALAASHPQLATLVDIGDSWEKGALPGSGYDLVVLRLTHSAIAGPKPRLLVIGGIHAREYTTAELATRFAEYLVAGYGTDADITWLLDYHEVHLLLQANPDGRKRAEAGLSWRKNANNLYCPNTSDRGADLNRNFSFQWGCCGASGTNPCDATFRGASAGSEPEVAAIEDYATLLFPDQRDPALSSPAPADATGTVIDLHSFGGDVLWSWGFTTTQPPNGPALYTLGRKYAFFNGYRPQHGSLSATEGTSKDFAYGELGVPGFTFELGSDFFEDCAAFESSILPGNLQALLFAAKVVRTPYQTPAGPEAVAAQVATPAGGGGVAVLTPGETGTVTAVLDDARFSTANGVEPSQNVAAAELFLDLPPWSPGATPVAMSAADGAFSSPQEAVTAPLSTADLGLGRHTAFVRGSDAAGNDGPVSAAFFYLLDPAVSPHIEGTVRDAVTAAPLAATVRATGGFEAATDGGTGGYSLLLPAGTYDVTASAPGYGAVTASGVAAADLQTVVQDFDLVPFLRLLDDDAEGGGPSWSAQPPWAVTSEQAHSPSHAWTDSPGGSYANNADTSLTSPVLDLSAATGTRLSFWQRYDLESGFDFARVEISTNGGSSWVPVTSFTGTQGSWQLQELALPALDGAAQARLRFRLTSDVSITRDGWYLDDVLLEAVVPPVGELVFADGFESGDLQAWTLSSGALP